MQSVRVPMGGMPEFTDVMVVNTHAPATAWSQPNMVHSGLDLIPKVGNAIPIDASVRAPLRGVAWIERGRWSPILLFLLKFGWADERANGTPRDAYQRKRRPPLCRCLRCFHASPSSPPFNSRDEAGSTNQRWPSHCVPGRPLGP